MPTILGHAVAATALRQWAPFRAAPRGLWLWSAGCAMLPDADVLAFSFGLPYDSMLGHRGLSHSLIAAVVVGMVVARVSLGPAGRRTVPGGRWGYWQLAIYFAVITASHGALDAVTNGGRG